MISMLQKIVVPAIIFLHLRERYRQNQLSPGVNTCAKVDVLIDSASNTAVMKNLF